jgi:hypothetical protein
VNPHIESRQSHAIHHLVIWPYGLLYRGPGPQTFATLLVVSGNSRCGNAHSARIH